MADLHGILPPDAGRAERAARDYAIAVLSWTNGLCALDALGKVCSADGLAGWDVLAGVLEAPMEDPHTECRLLRARVALYLRWCRRVEAGRSHHWLGRAPYDDGSGAVDAASVESFDALSSYLRRKDLAPASWIPWRPLWTLAPAHDPAMGPAVRRNRRPKA